jgi:uncharacterized protein (DUF1810 family)
MARSRRQTTSPSSSSRAHLDLTPFWTAQQDRTHGSSYRTALSEIRRGRKTSHWVWYVFPQLAGFSLSPTSKFFALADLEEAAAYLRDERLGGRLVEITREVLRSGEGNVRKLMGGVTDAQKLHASVTLFGLAAAMLDEGEGGEEKKGLFEGVLGKYFEGKPHVETVEKLDEKAEEEPSQLKEEADAGEDEDPDA